jgi:RNA polymerase sigma-70 factor, ECF subfamily
VEKPKPSADHRRPSEVADWALFVESSYPTVWRFCAALANRAAADDLAQETFLRATRSLTKFRGEASGRTWILSIARSVCMDELRRQYRRDRRDQRLRAAGPSPLAAEDASADLATRDLLQALEPNRRVAFALTQVFQLSYAEAAQVCGCPVGTIRSRVARAREDLITVIGRDHAGRHSASRG